jgi:hypothetical protein
LDVVERERVISARQINSKESRVAGKEIWNMRKDPKNDSMKTVKEKKRLRKGKDCS